MIQYTGMTALYCTSCGVEVATGGRTPEGTVENITFDPEASVKEFSPVVNGMRRDDFAALSVLHIARGGIVTHNIVA